MFTLYCMLPCFQCLAGLQLPTIAHSLNKLVYNLLVHHVSQVPMLSDFIMLNALYRLILRHAFSNTRLPNWLLRIHCSRIYFLELKFIYPLLILNTL